MKPNRQIVLGLAFSLTVGLVVWTAWNERQSEVSTPTKDNRTATKVSSTMSATVGRLSPASTSSESVAVRDPFIESKNDPFKVVSFLPPPPKVVPVAPSPPPKPTAPPFPYQYFGRMTDINGTVVTYLVRNNELSIVKEKQILEGVFEIESMNDSQLIVKYLPLDENSIIPLQTAEKSGNS